MTRSTLVSRFHGSSLIRCLADLGVSDVAPPAEEFARRLAECLDFSGAIVLSSAGAVATRDAADSLAGDFQVAHEFRQGRARMEAAIARSFGPDPGPARPRCPSVVMGPDVDVTRAFEPFHRFYLVQQRDMEFGVRQLQAGIRQSLSSLSPRLRRLAALDRAFDEVLGDRARRLLSQVPVLLAQRFRALCEEPVIAEARRPTDAGMEPRLFRFRQDIHVLLLAELDIRLQPLAGLVDAHSEEVQGHHA